MRFGRESQDDRSGRPDQARCLMSVTLCPVRLETGSDTRAFIELSHSHGLRAR